MAQRFVCDRCHRVAPDKSLLSNRHKDGYLDFAAGTSTVKASRITRELCVTCTDSLRKWLDESVHIIDVPEMG